MLLSNADRPMSSSSQPVAKDLCKNVKVFIVDFFFQYVSLSKRFVPEAVNFLGGILFLASKKEGPARKYQPTLRAFQWNNILWWERFFWSFICVDNIAFHWAPGWSSRTFCFFAAHLVLPFKHSSKWRDLLKLQSDSRSVLKVCPWVSSGICFRNIFRLLCFCFPWKRFSLQLCVRMFTCVNVCVRVVLATMTSTFASR